VRRQGGEDARVPSCAASQDRKPARAGKFLWKTGRRRSGEGLAIRLNLR
jgi:hypothetical protein